MAEPAEVEASLREAKAQQLLVTLGIEKHSKQAADAQGLGGSDASLSLLDALTAADIDREYLLLLRLDLAPAPSSHCLFLGRTCLASAAVELVGEEAMHLLHTNSNSKKALKLRKFLKNELRKKGLMEPTGVAAAAVFGCFSPAPLTLHPICFCHNAPPQTTCPPGMKGCRGCLCRRRWCLPTRMKPFATLSSICMTPVRQQPSFRQPCGL